SDTAGAARANASVAHPESLGVAAKIRVPVFGPRLPASPNLRFPTRAHRAANPRVAPAHLSGCRSEWGRAARRRAAEQAAVVRERAADFSKCDATRHVHEAPGRDKSPQTAADRGITCLLD